MPRLEERLFIGIKNMVLCLDARDGSEIWRTKLGTGSLVETGTFVNVFWDGEMLLASSSGEIFCLDPKTGALNWQNKLKGLGTGLVTFASTRLPSSSTIAASSEQLRRAAAAAHGAASAGA